MTISIQSVEQLKNKKCQVCQGGTPKYSPQQAAEQLRQLGDQWSLSADGLVISRKWQLKNFVQALELANLIGQVAEAEQHHPDLHLTDYRFLQVQLTTHDSGGLSENDFILAAKIDRLQA